MAAADDIDKTDKTDDIAEPAATDDIDDKTAATDNVNQVGSGNDGAFEAGPGSPFNPDGSPRWTAARVQGYGPPALSSL